jgi:aspartokinase
MSKVRLGGIKAFEKRAYLASWCRSGEDSLVDICGRFAAEKINLSLLTHIADNGTHESITTACTGNAESSSSYDLWKLSHGECNVGKLLTDISIISIFPHDQKLDVTGSLMGVLAGKGVRPHGLASSPSAMTMLVSSENFEEIIYGLFDAFEFPTYSSPLDWHAAYRGQEELLSEIICSYEEDIIKVYNVTQYDDLDLWNIILPFGSLGDLSTALFELNQLQLRMPFLVSKTSLDASRMCFAFCFAAARYDEVRRVFDRCLAARDLFCNGPVSVFFMHGPHFGDRHGIASTCIRSLGNAGIVPLAVSCTVSSISVVVEGKDSNRIITALDSSFQIPVKKL